MGLRVNKLISCIMRDICSFLFKERTLLIRFAVREIELFLDPTFPNSAFISAADGTARIYAVA